MTGRFYRARKIVASATVSATLAGCAQTPMGSTVQVMPGPGKSFDAFQADQNDCKVFAAAQVKGQAEQANQRAVGAAVLTTLLGAGLGAGAGAPWGSAGQGAGVGAAAGAAAGAAVGANMSANEQVGIQVQYDNAFSQCMFAKGEMVPGFSPPAPALAAASPTTYGSVSGGPDPNLVRSVQTELVRLNYLQDTPDGVLGGRTRSAISSYERANGMPADGTASPKLLARLQGTPTGASTATASASSGWVAPSQGTAAAKVVPAAATTPSAPSNWVAPKPQ